jgi:uncharacterized protein YhaN
MSLRLERFELRAFGPFTRTELELGGVAGGGLHIICGPNEVGKSSAQRGIGDFLFGIAPRSTDNHVHPYGDMRLAAVLIDEHGRRHDLVRRKGTRSTLLGTDQQPVDDGLLDGMLGGMTREAFDSMFSITHESLVVGGKALLAADGNVGESLFSASLGAAGLHALRVQLDEQAGALFRPRASSTAVVQARAALDAAHAELREQTLRATTFTEHERHVRAADTDRTTLVVDIGRARTAQNGRERLRNVIPLLATRARAVEELEALADAPQLPIDASERRLIAAEREVAGRNNARDAQARVEQLEQRIGEIELDATLLGRELAIKDLYGRLANVREGAGDLGRQTIKLEGATRLAQRALEQVRPDLKLVDASQLRLTSAQRAAVERALQRHAQLTALLEAARQSADEASAATDELAEHLGACAAPTETAPLGAAVNAAQADGQVEARLVEAERDLSDAVDQLDAELRQLYPTADIDALRAMRPPTPAAVGLFADERDALDARSRKLTDARDRLGAHHRELQEAFASLATETNVPTVDDLGVARRQRDEEWRELRDRLEGRVATSASPDTFEGHVHHADDVADRLRTEADSVARHAELTARGDRLHADGHALDEDERRLVEDRREHDNRWSAAWETTGLAPETPREMTEWLRCRQSILERADVVARHRRSVEVQRCAHDGHIESLRALVSQDTTAISTLNALVALAQAEISDAQAAREKHDELTRDLRAARAAAGRHHDKADQHRAAVDRWDEQWASIVATNRWPQDVTADSAPQVLDAVTELTAQLHEIDQLTTRVTGIQDRLDAFDDDAGALIADVAVDLVSWPLHDAIAELDRRVSDAIQARVSRGTLEGELDAARDELASANLSVDVAAQELATLLTLAGVATHDELPEAERQSSRVAELHELLPELERQITDIGHGALNELIERGEGVDVDALDADSAEGDDEINRLEDQLRELNVHIGALGGEQRKMECLQGAAGAAEKVEQRLAHLRELAERYVLLDLASWALSEAIDAYRREHKAPVLKRADELFPQLTCGAFQGLEVSFDEADDPVLVGVRCSGEKVSVKVMSTGTREQLYLSLRLASLERHIDLRGPMPVILDDVVLHSDPKRKTAILRALADLGHRTQVITFTHDPQVVALAQSAIDPSRLTVHELGGNEITGALQPHISIAAVRPIRPSASGAGGRRALG